MTRHDLSELIQDIVVLLQTQATLHNVEIHFHPTKEFVQSRCDGNKIKQLFINLFKNAIEAMPQGGSVWIEQMRCDEWVKVSIRDNGIGIPQELLQKIGQPFFTEKETGTGLGKGECLVLMADIQAFQQYVQIQCEKERRETIGDMAAGTAYIILNPLAVIKGTLQLLEKSLKDHVSVLQFVASPPHQK